MPAGDPAGGELGLRGTDRLRRAGDHTEGRSVDGRERQILSQPQTPAELLFGQRHSQHDPRRLALHQAAAQRRQAERILQREDISQAGRHQLAHAVPHHRCRTDPPLHPQLGQRVLHGEERRLRELAPPQAGLGVRSPSRRRIEDVPQVDVQHRSEQLRATVDPSAEGRLARVEGTAHADVLAPLSGEEEDDGAGGRAAHPAPDPGRVLRAQGGDGAARVLGEREAPVREPPATGLQGERHIRQARVRLALQLIGQVRGEVLQRRGCPGREHQQLMAPRGGGHRRRGRLLQHHMGVGAADAERADAGAPRRSGGGPAGEGGVDVERALGKGDRGVRRFEV